MRLKITHETRFAYSAPATYALIQIRMHPRSQRLQSVLSWDLHLEGARHHASFSDQYGTHVDLIEAEAGVSSVGIRVIGEIETRSEAGIVGHQPTRMPLWFYRRPTELTQADTHIRSFANEIQTAKSDPLSALHQLSRTILARVPYKTGQTDVTTSASQALTLGAGVCQDHTHIFLALCRAMDIPARYVSGYLMMNNRLDQDASHAWAEAYLDDLGWVGFDVSNGISPDERYVKIGHGLDYADCAPTRGLLIGDTQEQLVVSIQVQQ